MEYLPLILDVVLVIVILASAIKSYNRGLFSTGIDFIGNIAGFFIAWFASNKYSGMVFDWLFKKKLVEQTYEYIQSSANLADAQYMVDGIAAWLPQSIVQKFTDKFAEAAVNFTQPSQEAAATIVDTLLGPISCIIIGVIIFIIVILICKLFTALLSKSLTMLNGIPGLGFLNRLGGFCMGAAIGGINVILISCLLSIIAIVTSNSWVFLNMDILSESKILAFTSIINPFLG